MRVARLTTPGAVHHIIARFVDRRWLLQHPDERTRYLSLLGRALTYSDWICLAYALMSNHIHLAMLAGRCPAESWLRRTHPPFASWMKARHDGLGVLFAGRPKTIAVYGEDKVRDLLAYIHNNPVRAGVVEHADESEWTSHRAYVARAAPPPWLSVERGLQLSGVSDAGTFHKIVLASETIERAEETDRILAATARKAHRRGAVEVATPELRETTVIPLVARTYAAVRVDPRAVIDAVVGVLGTRREAAMTRKSREGIRVRRYVFAVGRSMGLTIAELAAATGVSSTTGSRVAEKPTDDLDAAVISVAQKRLISRTGEMEKRPRSRVRNR
jgi:hypothetical protein